MRKSLLITAIALMTLGLMGCGKQEDVTFSYDKNTLVLHEKEGVTEYMVEEFQQDNYVEQELRDQMEAEISDYNGDGKDNIELKRFELAEGTAKAIVTYDTCNDYMTFNDMVLYCGNASEIKEAGYQMPDSMVSVESKKKVSRSQVAKTENCKFVVYEGNYDLVPWDQVLYTDDTTTVSDDGKVTFGEEGIHFLVIAVKPEEDK